MATESPVVALFDVDGTLVRTEGASRHTRSFKAAFRTVYGAECAFTAGMHGMTDLQIFMIIARELKLGDGREKELAASDLRSMVEIYSVRDETDGIYVALPGVRDLLEQMQRRGILLGLVTGNVPEIARDKLGEVGLDSFFKFGAFGSEGDERTVLPPLAVSRAEALSGVRVDPRRVFIIGDTARDVACALDNGYRAVAVATGHVPMEDLMKSGAELVLPDLTHPGPLLELVDARGRLPGK